MTATTKTVHVRLERLVRGDGSAPARRTVFCPRAKRTVPLDPCASCAFRAGGPLEAEAESIVCEVDEYVTPTLASIPVGTLVRGRLTCVARDLRFAALRAMGFEQPLIPVIGARDDQLVGCLATALLTVSYDLPPRARAALLDTAQVGDLMTCLPAVSEDEPLLAAAVAMRQAFVRQLPVVTREGRCAGVVDDLALLRAATRSSGA